MIVYFGSKVEIREEIWSITLVKFFFTMQSVFRRRQQGTEWRNLRSLGQKDLRRQRNSRVPRYYFFIARQYKKRNIATGFLSICHIVIQCLNDCTYGKTFSASVMAIILVFRTRTMLQNSDAATLNEGNKQGIEKNLLLSTKIALCMGNATRQARRLP